MYFLQYAPDNSKDTSFLFWMQVCFNEIYNITAYGKQIRRTVQIVNVNCLTINFDAMTTIYISCYLHLCYLLFLYYSILCGWEKGILPNLLIFFFSSLPCIYFFLGFQKSSDLAARNWSQAEIIISHCSKSSSISVLP